MSDCSGSLLLFSYAYVSPYHQITQGVPSPMTKQEASKNMVRRIGWVKEGLLVMTSSQPSEAAQKKKIEKKPTL